MQIAVGTGASTACFTRGKTRFGGDDRFVSSAGDREREQKTVSEIPCYCCKLPSDVLVRNSFLTRLIG